MNIFVREMQKRQRTRQKETAEAKLASIARAATTEQEKLTELNTYLELCGYKNDLPQAERARQIVWPGTTRLGAMIEQQTMNSQSVEETRTALRITITNATMHSRRSKRTTVHMAPVVTNRCDKTCGKVHFSHNDVRREGHHYCTDKNCQGFDKLGHIDEMRMESEISSHE